MWHALDAGVTPKYYCILQGRQFELNRPARRFPHGRKRGFERWEGTPLWKAVESAVADLVQNGALVEDTFRETVVDNICRAVGRRKKAVGEIKYQEERATNEKPKADQSARGRGYFFSPIRPVRTRKLVSSLPDMKSGWARIFRCNGIDV